jgi:phosphate transport system permease protein
MLVDIEDAASRHPGRYGPVNRALSTCERALSATTAASRLSRMSTPPATATGFPSRRHTADRLGDRMLLGLTFAASLAAVVVIGLIIYKLVDGAGSSVSTFGLGFLWHSTWNPSDSPGVINASVFGAGTLIYGTVTTSAISLLIAVPLGVAIGVYLSLLAPGRVGAVIGPLVELLAAIPSVILGLWGILILAPVMRSTIEPALHNVFGFIPIFGAPSPTGLGVFTAGVVLAIMVLPIIASISRDLFLSVPDQLKDGALALGATRWEMIRGVVLDSTRAGLAAATILGLSRALGEAIAVTQLMGAGSILSANLFNTGDSLASRIAEQVTNSQTTKQLAALFYCALVLLAMELLVNLMAQLIVRRFDRRQGIVH